MTTRRLLAQPWLNGLVAMVLFFAPAAIIGALLGPQACLGALLYLLSLFLVGTVSVTWVPWREKFSRSERAIPRVGFPGEEEA